MTSPSSKTRPENPPLRARPRSRLLLIALGVVLLGFLASLPWQLRNWRDAAAVRQDAARQQARMEQLQALQGNRRRAEDAVRQAPADPQALLASAAALAQSRDFPGAAARLRALEPSAARSADLAGSAAELYQKIGYLDRAMAMARRAYALAPDSSAAWTRLGVLNMQAGREKEGRALLVRAVQAQPDAPEAHLALALADNQTGDYPGAERELTQAARLRPGDWQIQALQADNQAAQRRGEAAIQIVTNALRLAPQEPTLYARLARLRLASAQKSQSGGTPDIALAVQAARQCLALDPGSADAHDILGAAFQTAGQDRDARREWEAALALAPGSRTLLYTLGRLRIAQGDRAGGLALLAEAARQGADESAYDKRVGQAGLSPGNPEFHRQLARWCQAHGRLSRAIFEWQEVSALLPQDAEARQSAARLLKQRG